MNKDTPCTLAGRFPLLEDLNENDRAQLLSRGALRQFGKGEVLFLEGDQCKGLFLIRQGAVKIFKEAENGREQILAILRAGDSVAELPLFDEVPYPASAAATEDSTILFIPKSALDDAMTRNPALSRAIIHALARRMRTLVELIADLSLRQVRQRLARFLLAESEGKAVFRLTLTNEELAARLGSVRDVISRTLSSLQNDELIRVEGRQVEIIDRENLAEEAG